jgi:DNA-binding MarR family transcriptional regulator
MPITQRSIFREVDAAVDFARGWLQLRMLLTVGYLGRCSVDRLVEVLGGRREAVLDSLRKMRAKGLVEGEGGLSSRRRVGGCTAL